MPPEQNKNKNTDSAAGRAPIIRTMQTDVDEFLKTAKPSLASMIGTARTNVFAGERRRSNIPIILIVSVAGIAVLGGGGFFLLRSLSGSSFFGASNPTAPAVQKLTPPPPFFATETSRTITVDTNNRADFVRLMTDSMAENEREGTVKRIIIRVKDGPQERFATFADFFDLWRIAPPQSLANQIEAPPMLFVHSGKNGRRLGLVARTKNPDRTLADMLSWEPGLLSAFTPLFFDEKINSVIAPFEDRTYRNIDWRYLKLSQQSDLGIAHAIFPANNIFIVTTSKEAMETVINRLFDAR